jgi:hypothetical protein
MSAFGSHHARLHPPPIPVTMNTATEGGKGNILSTVSSLHTLDSVNGGIRLLAWTKESTSTTADQTLGCSLSYTFTYTTLSRGVRFSALSYVWGSIEKTKMIQLDGRLVPIGANLEAALRSIQSRRMNVDYLWVDALCINQNDEAEKSQQVHLMGRIYQAAEYVIAWLGDETWGSHIIYSTAASIFPNGGPANSITYPTSTQFGDSSRNDLISRPELLRPVPYQGIQDIISRPYWRRIWVLQEVTVAKTVYIMCGAGMLEWDNLFYILQILGFELPAKDRFGQNLFSYQILENPMSKMSSVRYHFQKSPIAGKSSHTLENLLIQTSIWERSMRATDPRDKIYALLGISTDAEAIGIWPSYSNTWQEVYEGTAAILLQKCSLKILSCCVFKDSSPIDMSSVGSLPSWVPNWASEVPIMLVPPTVGYTSTLKFSASGLTKSTPRFLGHASSRKTGNHTTLVLQGVLVDAVQTTSLPWQKLESNSAHHHCQWLKHIEEFSRQGNSIYLPGHGQLESVWRTPIANTRLDEDGGIGRASKVEFGKYQAIVRESSTEVDSSLDVSSFMRAIDLRAHHKRVFKSNMGYLGLGSSAIIPGDAVFIILGADVPFVLRKTDETRFQIIGEAYVHGIMDGEIITKEAQITDILVC